MEKKKVPIRDGLMMLDMQTQIFDMQKIKNRRFMYNPQTDTLILGFQYGRNEIYASHAEEHGSSGTRDAYDSFIRGWVGTGKEYPNGVIHFAPPVGKRNMDMFVKAFNTLVMFRENNADGGTVVRGFGDTWEQPLSAVLPFDRDAPKTEKPSVLSQLKTGQAKQEETPKKAVRQENER